MVMINFFFRSSTSATVTFGGDFAYFLVLIPKRKYWNSLWSSKISLAPKIEPPIVQSHQYSGIESIAKKLKALIGLRWISVIGKQTERFTRGSRSVKLITMNFCSDNSYVSEQTNSYQSYFKESNIVHYINILTKYLENSMITGDYLGNILFVISPSLYFDLCWETALP